LPVTVVFKSLGVAPGGMAGRAAHPASARQAHSGIGRGPDPERAILLGGASARRMGEAEKRLSRPRLSG
jgi:hypothetical protein